MKETALDEEKYVLEVEDIVKMIVGE